MDCADSVDAPERKSSQDAASDKGASKKEDALGSDPKKLQIKPMQSSEEKYKLISPRQMEI